MANAEYHKGQTIDPDEKFVKIEGEKYCYGYKEEDKRYSYDFGRKKYLNI